MLPDLERKLLRILWNISNQRRRNPTWEELQRMTGQHKASILAGLQHLEEKQYIIWSDRTDLQGIVIIEGWERSECSSVKVNDL